MTVSPSQEEIENAWGNYISKATGIAVGPSLRIGYQEFGSPTYDGKPIITYTVRPAFGEWGDQDITLSDDGLTHESSYTRRMACLISITGYDGDTAENIRRGINTLAREQLTALNIYPLSHPDAPERIPIFYNAKWIDVYWLEVYFNVATTYTATTDYYDQFPIQPIKQG